MKNIERATGWRKRQIFERENMQIGKSMTLEEWQQNQLKVATGVSQPEEETHSATYVSLIEELEAFTKLVEDKATEKANARANASWTLMCKKMVAAEREALANYFDAMPGLEMFGSTVADEIREWGQE